MSRTFFDSTMVIPYKKGENIRELIELHLSEKIPLKTYFYKYNKQKDLLKVKYCIDKDKVDRNKQARQRQQKIIRMAAGLIFLLLLSAANLVILSFKQQSNTVYLKKRLLENNRLYHEQKKIKQRLQAKKKNRKVCAFLKKLLSLSIVIDSLQIKNKMYFFEGRLDTVMLEKSREYLLQVLQIKEAFKKGEWIFLMAQGVL